MNIKNDIRIMPRSMVCEDTNLRGEITISSGCVIHPSTTIIAESGPIVIGENCIIEEYASIIHRIPKGHSSYGDVLEGTVKPLVIGQDNIFEVGCTVEALKIGERNVFECKSYVSADVVVTNGCVIGAGCRLVGEQVLPEKTIIYGKQCQQREALEKQRSQMVQIDYLRKILPNYHHLKKASYDPKKVRAQV
ncbi:dynactin subunit 6 [Topomyia yanbarensis]|uniref:dynactin subunit 6 n=1 Tax=Topomyia yanbarensis TaxID=2498891 RepID=UPI00273B32BF|nr:dynactin subunit 6 [Topomyia yanbarensis]